MNININISGFHGRLKFQPRSMKLLSAPKRTLKGLKVQYQLADDTAVNFALTGTDEWGNPTNTGLGVPTIGSISDPTILTATVQPDNSIEITPLGKLGVSQVVVNVPVGNATLTGTLDVTVVAGSATSIAFVPGNTTPVTNTPVVNPPVVNPPTA